MNVNESTCMDPVTVLGTASAVVQLAGAVSSVLNAFVYASRGVNERVEALHLELTTLSAATKSVETSLQDGKVRKSGPSQLWQDVDKSLIAVQTTLVRFKAQLDALPEPPPLPTPFNRSMSGEGGVVGSAKHIVRRGRSFFKEGFRQYKLSLRVEDVDRLRVQVQTHNAALQLVLLTISVHVTTTTCEATIEDISPKLDGLVTRLDGFTVSRELGADAQSQYIVQASDILMEAAKVVASNASDVVDARSTVWEGSVADPVDSLRRLRIQEWIDAPVSAAPTSTLGENAELAERSLADEQDSKAQTMGHPEDAVLDAEEELQLELSKSYESLARKRLDNEQYSEAEEFIRGALDGLPRRDSKQSDLAARKASLELMLATTCYILDKLDEAKELCEKLIHSGQDAGVTRSIVVYASIKLTRIYFRRGDLSDAARQCRQTVVAIRRYCPDDPGYFICVSLMVAILKAQDDHLQMEVWENMLPSDYQAPFIKLPLEKADEAGKTDEEGATETLRRYEIDFEEFGPDKTLLWAAEHGYANVVNYALENGASINAKRSKDSDTACHVASLMGHKKVLVRLLKAGANVTARARLQATPMHLAARQGQVEAMELLIDAGADINARTAFRETPLMYACRGFAKRDSTLLAVEWLLNRGANISMKNVGFATTLHFAVKSANVEPEVAWTLVRAGAEVDAKDVNGWTPLTHAVAYGNVRMVKELISLGADVKVPVSNSDLFHLLLTRSYKSPRTPADIMQILVDHGLDINRKDKFGQTPLMTALSYHSMDSDVVKTVVHNQDRETIVV